MDAAQWPQGARAVEYSRDVDVEVEKKARPHEALNCPRCNSTNTKFCYYNNYSLSQPRYFCKTCRRYWTAGGTLRNVPVGGSSRKNMKRSSSTSSSKKFVPDLSLVTENHDGQDPPIYNGISALPFALHPQNPNSSVFKTAASGGGLGLSSFISASASASAAVCNSNSSGFPMHDLKPGLSYCQDELDLGNRFGNLRSTVEESKTNFPFEEARADANENENGVQQNGYWSGMLSGGPW